MGKACELEAMVRVFEIVGTMKFIMAGRFLSTLGMKTKCNSNCPYCMPKKEKDLEELL